MNEFLVALASAAVGLTVRLPHTAQCYSHGRNLAGMTRMGNQDSMAPTRTVMSLLDLDPRKLGTMEEYMIWVTRGLRQRGWNSVLAFSTPVNEIMARHFQDAGATVESLSNQQGQLRRAVRHLVGKYRPDITHFHFFNVFSMLPMDAWYAGAKHILFTEHVRQPGNLPLKTRVKCAVFDSLVIGALGVKVLAVSEHIERVMADYFHVSRRHLEVLHNGVNVGRFTPATPQEVAKIRAELGVADSRPVVVCASALRPEKGIDDLLVATRTVLQVLPQALLYIIGDGPMAESLRRQAEDLKLGPNVQFTGLRSDVQQFMKMANVVAAPSTWEEPASLVLLEAAAVGRPVISTRTGGTPEHVADGETGVLVAPHAPDQLASAVVDLLQHPDKARQMGDAGRRRVEKLFSLDRWAADTIRIYERTLGAA